MIWSEYWRPKRTNATRNEAKLKLERERTTQTSGRKNRRTNSRRFSESFFEKLCCNGYLVIM